MDKKEISRRSFVKNSFAAAALIGLSACGNLSSIRKPGERYRSPSGKLNIAVIGAGGRGAWDLYEMANETADINIVGLCDLDEIYMKAKINQVCPAFIDKPYYSDYRIMFDKIGKEIDAVMISTPDHSHALITMDCMKRGKHIYTQKPLTHNIFEARILKETAKELNLVSQMGIQNRSSKALRMGVDFLKSGVLGPIREVHLWTDRPAWKQDIPRPQETPAIPERFDWDHWIGPAPYRPYHPIYHPFHWRGFWDFGTGALGDMGCHIFDQPFWALDLRDPTSVEAVASNTGWWQPDLDLSETGPIASILRYEFPRRGNRAPLTLFWYDGGIRPLRPAQLEEDRELPANGMMYVGDNGTAMCAFITAPRLIPESKMKGFKFPGQIVPDSPGHFKEWVDACTGNGPVPGANFDYSSDLTETVLLGCVALRAGVGRKYLWDSKNMRVSNFPEANRFVKEEYRDGWTL